MRKLIALAVIVLTTACAQNPPPDHQSEPSVPFLRDAQSGIDNLYRISRHVVPVAKGICREFHWDKAEVFCDFEIKVINDPNQQPNAFQSVGEDGRSIIIFTINILRSYRNNHELAFIMGHEAGHQIAHHRSFSRTFELQADTIAAHIVERSGFSVALGARSIEHFKGAAERSPTHPSSKERIAHLAETVTAINAARVQGRHAPLAW